MHVMCTHRLLIQSACDVSLVTDRIIQSISVGLCRAKVKEGGEGIESRGAGTAYHTALRAHYSSEFRNKCLELPESIYIFSS